MNVPDWDCSLHGSSVTPVPSESDVVTSKTSPGSGPGGTQSEMSASAPSRVSPLRGNSTAEEIVHQVRSTVMHQEMKEPTKLFMERGK